MAKAVEAVVNATSERGQRIASCAATEGGGRDDEVAFFDNSWIRSEVGPNHGNSEMFEGLDKALVDEAVRMPLAPQAPHHDLAEVFRITKCLNSGFAHLLLLQYHLYVEVDQASP